MLTDRHDAGRRAARGLPEAAHEFVLGEPAREHHEIAPEGDGSGGGEPGRSVCHDGHPARYLRQRAAPARSDGPGPLPGARGAELPTGQLPFPERPAERGAPGGGFLSEPAAVSA